MKLIGLDRVAIGVERSGLAGQRTINVEAEYRNGRRQVMLQILYSKTIAERLGFGGPSTSGVRSRNRRGLFAPSESWRGDHR